MQPNQYPYASPDYIFQQVYAIKNEVEKQTGQYYTLFEIAEFDANGLWQYDEIGFSRHGTLLDTIVYLVDQSPEGMTNNELQEKFHLVVKAALIDLVKKKKLVREKRTNRYVYLSSDLTKGRKQLKRREEFTFDSSLDDSISLRVLLMAYRLVGGSASPKQVATSLKKEGSKITLEVVRQVFQKYDIVKKNSGLLLLPLIKELRHQAVDKLAPRSCFINPQFIPTETSLCQCNCGESLKVQKTQMRSVVLLDFGEILFKETIKYCSVCKSIFGSERLSDLVPDYANFSFEIIEFVGRMLFVVHYGEQKVLEVLVKRNVVISWQHHFEILMLKQH
jgi:hypothetical protein